MKVRDKFDVVWVQEKLDGSCTAVAMVNGQIVALSRAGHLASSSRFVQHQYFAEWVRRNDGRFRSVLKEGERIVGEWLAQAHGTRYDLTGREPFVAFDLFRDGKRLTVEEFIVEADKGGFATPNTWRGPMAIKDAMARVDPSFYGALDPVEGVIYRVERHGRVGFTMLKEVDFLAKFVRPDKRDGSYLESVTGGEPVWNWRP